MVYTGKLVRESGMLLAGDHPMPAECQHPFDISLASSDGGGAPETRLSPAVGHPDAVRVLLAAARMTAPVMLSVTLWAIIGWAVWKGG